MADDVAARIRSGILCFCAGDALGVPWQGMRPEEVDAGLLDELPARNGRAGGATSALGWAGVDRNAIGVFTRTTHAAPEALEAARVAAAMAEAALVRGRLPARRRGWRPPRDGVSSDALETVAAARYVVSTHHDPGRAMRTAVTLGGDTRGVAALAGAILGCRDPNEWRDVPWLGRVQVPLEVDELGVRLAALRARSAPPRLRRRRAP